MRSHKIRSRTSRTQELEALVPDWEFTRQLTKTEALVSLTETFVAGYTDYETDEEIEFDLDDLEWARSKLELSDLTPKSSSDIERVREAWPDCEISALRWEAGIKNCGNLIRSCVRFVLNGSPRRYRWYMQPPDWDDQFQDRTFGPMWEGS